MDGAVGFALHSTLGPNRVCPHVQAGYRFLRAARPGQVLRVEAWALRSGATSVTPASRSAIRTGPCCARGSRPTRSSARRARRVDASGPQQEGEKHDAERGQPCCRNEAEAMARRGRRRPRDEDERGDADGGAHLAAVLRSPATVPRSASPTADVPSVVAATDAAPRPNPATTPHATRPARPPPAGQAGRGGGGSRADQRDAARDDGARGDLHARGGRRARDDGDAEREQDDAGAGGPEPEDVLEVEGGQDAARRSSPQ
jgi:hypothetical protein